MSDKDILDTEDPYQYSILSETTDMDDFIKVCEEAEGEDSSLELPKEEDGTVLISTVQGQFPNAVGLKYKSSSGGWRGVRIVDGVLKPPQGGFGDTQYFVTLKKNGATLKNVAVAKEDDKDEDLLEDLFVLRLHRSVTDEELREHFTKTCGEMALAEIKYDRDTGKSRGFGFIRFKTVEAAKEALSGEHEINGQKLEVRISRKKETPCQLFVGRLPEGTTRPDLIEYFSSYGEVSDAYITSPFRGFGFVTYASANVARSILRLKHEIKGARLNVAVAEPKEDKIRRGRFVDDGYDDRYDDRDRGGYRRRNTDDPRERSRRDVRYDPRRSRREESPPRPHEMMNELKNMLFDVMQQQGRR